MVQYTRQIGFQMNPDNGFAITGGTSGSDLTLTKLIICIA
jgi:hypothetical protein